MAGSTEEVRATERWFRARGLPHLTEEYSATEDVLTRAVPILTLVFLVELVGALNLEWTWWQNVLAAVGGIAFLLGVWALTNLARRQPAFSRPAHVGSVELAVFVLGPALLPLLFGGQRASAVVTGVANLVLLGLIYVSTSYGLIPMVRWGSGAMLRQLGDIFGLFARALPMLMLVVTFLFISDEVWAVAARLDAQSLVATAGLFVFAGAIFIASRLPAELERLARFEDDDEIDSLCEGTPIEAAARRHQNLAALARRSPLGRRQWGNVALLVVVSQAIQIVLVAAIVGVFFVVFGLVAIQPEVIATWVGPEVLDDPLLEATVLGKDVVLTIELLRVALFLSIFTGFYFTVYVVTDATFREEFFDEVVADVRQALAVRSAYLASRTWAVDDDGGPANQKAPGNIAPLRSTGFTP